MTSVIDYGRCECECGECAFGRHCHHGGYCHVGLEGPCTCGQCVSPFLATPKAGPHPLVPRLQSHVEPVPGWSLAVQKKKAGEPRKYRVVGPWRSALEDVERDMKRVAS